MAFDFKLAHTLAQLSQHAYDFTSSLPPELGAPEVVPLHDAKSHSTSHAGVYFWPNKTVVAYRGTMPNVADWLENFNTTLVASPLGGRVHEGFYAEFAGVQDQIDEELRAEHRVGRPLYVTGHSQGGAIAALATRHFEQRGMAVTSTYTFAAPRPGDAVFRGGITTPVHRVEYGYDIVPHVTPGIPGLDLGPVLNSWGAKIAIWFASPLVKQLLAMLENSVEYVSVGKLSYAPPQGALATEIGPHEERSLYLTRLAELIRARAELGQHHLLENYLRVLMGGADAVGASRRAA